MRSYFKIIDTTADVKIIAYGRKQEEIFEQSGQGLYFLITDPRHIRKKISIEIALQNDRREDLLVAWLNELLYRFSADGFLGKEFNITCSDTTPYTLSAVVWGETYDPAQHQIKTEIKAATYHQLKFIPEKTGYYCEVILDV